MKKITSVVCFVFAVLFFRASADVNAQEPLLPRPIDQDRCRIHVGEFL